MVPDNRLLRRCGLVTMLVLAGFWAGCLEVETTTEVYTDGSLRRSLVLRGDSVNIGRGMALFGIDSLWQTESRVSGSDEDEFAAVRSFSSAAEMSGVLRGARGSRISITVTLDRGFAWIFTTYRYTETWGRISGAEKVPLSDFLAPGEVEKINRHLLQKEPFAVRGDSLAVVDATDRFEAWQARNRFEKFFSILVDGVRRLADPALTVQGVEEKKEDLFRLAGPFDFVSGDIGNLGAALGDIVGGRQLRRALEAAGEDMEAFRSELRFEQMVLSYGYRVGVVLPGEITVTNAGSVEGNKASWENFIVFTSIGDFEMRAESRVVNWWVVVLSGVVLAVVAFFGVVRIIRKKPVAG